MRRARHAALWTGALAALALGLAPAAGAAAPDAHATAPRTSCVAPCAIFFDARGTSDSDLNDSEELVDLLYDWNFGDPGSGVWGEGARAGTPEPHSKNVDSGFVAGHVYEQPGSYTATLTVSDGASRDTDTLAISIQNPNTVWAGASTVCVAAASTPVAGSGGCPAGAAVARTSDFDAALRDHGCLTQSRRCLFRRGDVFTNDAFNDVTSQGPTLIGAYGSGPKPRVDSRPNVDTFRLDEAADVRIADLQIVGPNGNGLESGSAVHLKFRSHMRRILVLRLDITRFDHGIHLISGPNDAYRPGVDMPSEIAVVDSSVLDGPGYGGVDVFTMWEKSLFLGNRAGDKFDAANGLGEHVLRARFSHGVVYAHNSLGLLNDSGGRIGCGTLRHVMKIVSGTAVDFYPSGVSREHIIADNYISACKRNAIDVDVGRTDSQMEKVNEGQRTYLVERNHFVRPFADQGFHMSLSVEGEYGAVRNNVFDLSGPTPDGTRRAIRVWNRAPVASPPVPTREIRLYNNTCYASASSSGGGICVDLYSESDDAIVKNTLVYDPPGGGSVTVLGDQGTGTTTCSGCNLSFSQSPFVSAAPTSLQHFAPAAGSPAVDAGDPVAASPLNFTTFLGPLDGDDDGTARIDLGAWERDGDPPVGGGGTPPAPPILLP